MGKKDHFRAPVADAFRRKSQFDQLLEHMGKVRECIDILGDGLVGYYNGDYKDFSDLAKKVSEIEHEADLIKGNLRNRLPNSLFMPVDKGKFMWALRTRLKLKSSEALFLFINNSVVPAASQTIGQMYDQYAEQDKFLYITYTAENTFG